MRNANVRVVDDYARVAALFVREREMKTRGVSLREKLGWAKLKEGEMGEQAVCAHYGRAQRH